jgi:cadmium resistance protein CadD (predicted permease)
MFFARRRHHHSLLELILVLLGIKCLCRKDRGQGSEASKEEFRSKARLFRSKVREAFTVWDRDEEKAPEAAPEAPAEHQG